MRLLSLPRSSRSMITELGWSLRRKSALPSFFVRTGNSTQTPSYRLTLFFYVVIVPLSNGHFEPLWSSLFYGGLSRKVPISLRGASIVQTENGKITGWTDYYDGLTSRRTA